MRGVECNLWIGGNVRLKVQERGRSAYRVVLSVRLGKKDHVEKSF
jgi:hypothetical protein